MLPFKYNVLSRTFEYSATNSLSKVFLPKNMQQEPTWSLKYFSEIQMCLSNTNNLIVD